MSSNTASNNTSSDAAASATPAADRGKHDLYGVLRVDKTATGAVIRRAYFQLALTCVWSWLLLQVRCCSDQLNDWCIDFPRVQVPPG